MERCHPRVFRRDGTSGIVKTTGQMKTPCMSRYIKKIIIPFVMQKREALKLDKSHPALALFDCFRGQTTAEIMSLLERHNIVPAQIPPIANCMDKLQPMNISMNKPMKDEPSHF